jgi:hypothetical protein
MKAIISIATLALSMAFARVSAQELCGENSPIVSQCLAFYYLTFVSFTPNKLSHHFHLLLISQDEISKALGWQPPHNTYKKGCYGNGLVWDLVICLEFILNDELFSMAKCANCMSNAKKQKIPLSINHLYFIGGRWFLRGYQQL